MAQSPAEAGSTELEKAPAQPVSPSEVTKHDASGRGLQRGLKARHMSMIAIGGALGTGLVIGTGSALARAGPAGVLITYTIVGMVVYMVMGALGEMASVFPLPQGFSGLATRFVDPALGFALGYTYLCKYLVVTPNQLTAAALVIQYWVPPEKVNPGVFITVMLLGIIAINYLGIKFFGEFEFWLSSFKILVLIGLIFLSLVLACGGGPGTQEATGFQYWKDPGGFNTYIAQGAKGRFLATWSSMTTATFAYLGTELIGVTASECQNPRKNLPKAMRLTFWRIVIFYIVTIFLLGMIVPFDSELLRQANSKTTSASASPFVVAIETAGIRVLPQVLNACILVFVFSAANSDLYIASRTLYALASDDKAPKIFQKTDRRGVPYASLVLAVLFCLLAYLNVTDDSSRVFGYFVDLVTIFGLLVWISILVTHIGFIRAVKAQGVNRDLFPFKAPFAPYGSYVSLVFCCTVAFFKGYDTVAGGWQYSRFITSYIGIPIYLLLLFGWKLAKRTKAVRPKEADLRSDGREFDRGPVDKTPEHSQKRTLYRFVSWLF